MEDQNQFGYSKVGKLKVGKLMWKIKINLDNQKLENQNQFGYSKVGKSKVGKLMWKIKTNLEN